jgi:uncharacterized RmlC-like cupin family protein
MHSVNRTHGGQADPGPEVVAVAEARPRPPKRTTEPLSFGALRSVAAGVARSQSPLPPADDEAGAPRSLRLLATDLYDVWLVTWPPGSSRDFHGHGPVRSVLHVMDGELVEIFSDDGEAQAAGSRLLREGDAFCATPSFVHDLANQSEAEATTLHVYSPPLSSLTPVDPPAVAECDRLRTLAARHRFRQAANDQGPALRLPPLALVRRRRPIRPAALIADDCQSSESASSANVSQPSSASSSSA